MSNNLFEQLSILRATNELDSKLLKNKKRVSISRDPFVVLVELLKVLVGESGIDKGINKILKGVNGIHRDFKGFVKHEISDVLGGEKNKSKFDASFKINILKLSPNRKLMTKDVNVVATLTPFEQKINNAVKTKARININKTMSVSYNSTNGDLTFYFEGTNKPHVEILHDLIDEMEIIELSNIFYDVLDSLFNFSKKSVKELEDEGRINMIFTKFLDDQEIDDSYFKFDGDDVRFIEETIKIREINFYGEPDTDGSLTEEEYLNLVKGKRDLLGASFLTALAEIVTRNVFLTDKSTAKKKFLERFLQALVNVLVKKYLLSTEIIVIYNILFKSNSDVKELLFNNKNFYKCLYKRILNLILQILYAIIKKEIAKLIAGMAKGYTKEILNKYRKILTSLF